MATPAPPLTINPKPTSSEATTPFDFSIDGTVSRIVADYLIPTVSIIRLDYVSNHVEFDEHQGEDNLISSSSTTLLEVITTEAYTARKGMVVPPHYDDGNRTPGLRRDVKKEVCTEETIVFLKSKTTSRTANDSNLIYLSHSVLV